MNHSHACLSKRKTNNGNTSIKDEIRHNDIMAHHPRLTLWHILQPVSLHWFSLSQKLDPFCSLVTHLFSMMPQDMCLYCLIPKRVELIRNEARQTGELVFIKWDRQNVSVWVCVGNNGSCSHYSSHMYE